MDEREVPFSVSNIFSGVIDFELIEPSDFLVSSCFYGPLRMVVSDSSIDKFKAQTDVLPYTCGSQNKVSWSLGKDFQKPCRIFIM